MHKTWVRSLGWEDPLEEGMATHSSILAWRVPRTEEPGRLWSMGSQRIRQSCVTKHFLQSTEQNILMQFSSKEKKNVFFPSYFAISFQVIYTKLWMLGKLIVIIVSQYMYHLIFLCSLNVHSDICHCKSCLYNPLYVTV